MNKGRIRFRQGFKNGLLRKMFRAHFCHKWYKVNNRNEKTFLSDCRYFPEELVDFLLEVKPLTLVDARKAVNDWCHLETTMTGFPRVRYVVGEAENIFMLLKAQRGIFLSLKGV